MSAATSSRSCATSSRSGSASSRRSAASRSQAKAHLAAEERVLDALVGATASAATRESLPAQAARQRARRQGDRDRDAAGRSSGPADVRDPGHAGRLGRRDQPRRHVRQGLRRARQDRAARPCAEAYEPAGGRGIRQAPRPGRPRAGGDPPGREQRHRLPRRDRQDRAAARAAPAPTSRARACSATCCR